MKDNNTINTLFKAKYKTLLFSAVALGIGAGLVIHVNKYQQFYKVMALAPIQKKPSTFTYENRKTLDTHLNQLSGKGWGSQFILRRYITVNWYCDQNNIPLTNIELPFFLKVFNPGSQDFPDVLASESKMFNTSGILFPKESINYDVRMLRPDIAAFLISLGWRPQLELEKKKLS